MAKLCEETFVARRGQLQNEKAGAEQQVSAVAFE